MAGADQVRVITPLDRLWRRDAPAAAGALSPLADDGISVTLNQVDLEEGDWVTIDADGEADLVGATSSPAAFIVFRGGTDRRDTRFTEAVTLLLGTYEAFSKKFDVGGTYVNGTALTAKNGQLEEAGSGDFVVGHAFGAPASGELHFHTYYAGGVLA